MKRLLGLVLLLGCGQVSAPPGDDATAVPPQTTGSPDSKQTTLTNGPLLDALEKAGGKIKRNEQREVVQVDLDRAPISDQDLQHLVGLTSLQALWLDETGITDKGLKTLRGLDSLEELTLNGTQITDKGLAHLQGLTQLTGLYLLGNKITDAGLAELVGLTGLLQLWLDDTAVTDEGVAKLQKALPGCEILTNAKRPDDG